MKKILIVALLLIITFPAVYSQDKGYEKTIELNGGFGLSEYTKYSVGIFMINGYRFNSYIFFGAGLGFRYSKVIYFESYTYGETYNSIDGKYLIQPYLRIKGNITNTKISPFLLADVGWTFDVGKNPNKNVKDIFFEPQFGLDFKLQENMSIYLSVGANLQNYQYTFFYIGADDTNEEIYKHYIGVLNFHFGIKF